jgi:hypothetical protein
MRESLPGIAVGTGAVAALVAVVEVVDGTGVPLLLSGGLEG